MNKKLIPVIICIVSFIFIGCSKRITPWEAANGRAKCGRWLK